VEPIDLYTAHEQKARQVAQGLCHHYQYSGALAFQDEANSEALIALWKRCVRFDPMKQVLQRQQEANRLQAQADEILMASIFLYEPPAPVIVSDPYSTFWISSIQYVRGSVLDYFRAERIITKFVRRGTMQKLTPLQVKKLRNRIVDWDDEELLLRLANEYGIDVAEMADLRPTMLYQDRFISLSQLVSDRANGFHVQNNADLNQTVGDWIASESKTDANDDRRHMRSLIETLRDTAGLTADERQALDLCYSEQGDTVSEVGDMLGVSRREVEKRLSRAYEKMRVAAGQKAMELVGAA
jgi:RNA polymerase sigma factor (sigma-70 family)